MADNDLVLYSDRVRGRRFPRLHSSSIHGFADESHLSGEHDAVEALAEVSPQAMLPDNFGYPEVKFGHVRHLFERPGYSLKARWFDQFRHITIFLIDPRGLVRAVRREFSDYTSETLPPVAVRNRRIDNRVADALANMLPSAWMSTLEVRDGMTLYKFGDFAGFDEIKSSEIEAATSKKGHQLVNIRRRVLRSQALNKELLQYQPFRYSKDMSSVEIQIGHLPIRELAFSLGNKIAYDTGHSADIPRLLIGQQQKESLLKKATGRRSATNGTLLESNSVVEIDSAGHELVQLADFAAGYALSLYLDDSRRTDLPTIFGGVFINGVEM